MKSIYHEFTFPIINWDNEIEAAIQAEQLLSDLVKNKKILTNLLYNVETHSNLMNMCECHTYDDKIVLFNGLETHGYRIRFRLAKYVEKERIHNHRFTAIHHIITGQFQQKFYIPRKPIIACKAIEDFTFIQLSNHTKGESFEVNYKDFHSSQTTKGTISLLLRGPVKNSEAIGINCHDNSIRIRKGYNNSNIKENTEHKMPITTFINWVQILIKEEIIYSREYII